MKHYTTNKRYCPHEISTKLHSVQTYRQTKDISYVCRKYKISKPLWWGGISNMTARKNLWFLSLTVLTLLIPTLIPSRKSSGSRTITAETPIFLWASFTENLERTRHIPGIPALCTVCLFASDFAKRLSPQRRNLYIISTTILLQNLVSSGKWT